jgi:hypothetical protein
LLEVEGIDFVERQRVARSFANEPGVFAVAGGNRLHRRGILALRAPGTDQPAGEPRFADAGIGSGDEKAGHEMDRINKNCPQRTQKSFIFRENLLPIGGGRCSLRLSYV